MMFFFCENGIRDTGMGSFLAFFDVCIGLCGDITLHCYNRLLHANQHCYGVINQPISQPASEGHVSTENTASILPPLLYFSVCVISDH